MRRRDLLRMLGFGAVTAVAGGIVGYEEAPSHVSTVPPSAITPAQILNLKEWYLSVPTNQNVLTPQLAGGFTEATNFGVDTSVAFTAYCGDLPQAGSVYARSELREMNPDGKTKASWSTTSGVNTMEMTQRVTHLPVVKPQLICGQIHNDDYLILVELDANKLYVRLVDATVGVLDPNYQLGTYFDMKIVASQGFVAVYYNGVEKVNVALHATGCYFKAGCYVQSNTSTGDAPTAYGQVEIKSLTVSHTTAA